MALAQLLLASAAYAIGGLFMKQSEGLSQLRPTITFLALFMSGATVQALGMRHADLGPSYIFVLGVEALLAVLLSTFYLHESYSPSRLAAILLVVVGVVWLRQS
jgi:quaternary ammonium compound-resistance protein SugE